MAKEYLLNSRSKSKHPLRLQQRRHSRPADYIVWRNGLGTTYTQTDYDAWRANFGRSAAGAAAVAEGAPQPAVPEPGSLVLTALAFMSFVTHRRRERLKVSYENN